MRRRPRGVEAAGNGNSANRDSSPQDLYSKILGAQLLGWCAIQHILYLFLVHCPSYTVMPIDFEVSYLAEKITLYFAKSNVF